MWHTESSYELCKIRKECLKPAELEPKYIQIFSTFSHNGHLVFMYSGSIIIPYTNIPQAGCEPGI